MARALFVINPTSDGGKTGREWPQIASEARSRGLEVAERVTQGPGHASAIVREAIAAGEELIVAVGGDGTVNEVVNGFADDGGTPLETPARLGVIERGTGCDFIRTYGIPKRTRDAVALLTAHTTRRIDLGRARFTGYRGAEELRMYANAASCGMTGDVAARANRTTKRFGGTAGFLYATAAAFTRWQNVPFEIELDGERQELVANNVICANGRYLGGGMKLTPDAAQDDGLLDVLVIGDVGKVDLALNVGRLYRGTISRHPKVAAMRAARIACTPERPLPVEIDGEQPGLTPVVFDVAPSAVSLVIP
jgi:YegS/Rv2252/BmrU family lipid kinase